MDATDMKFKDSCFDKVSIALVLHEIDEELSDKLILEAKRVLKDDGIMFAPTFIHGEGVGFKLRTKLIELFGFKAFIKPTNDEFKKFIESNGFKVMEYDRVGSKLAPICCMIAKK